MTALVLTVLAWLPGVAVGAEDSYTASGQASGFAVNIPEVTEIATGGSEADIDSDLLAHGRGVGVLIADGSISEVTVEQPGVTERDPAEGQNCATPQLPEPLDIVAAACSFALGSTVDGLPRGLGDATGLEVELTGADVTALVDFLLDNIVDGDLEDAIAEVESSVIEPVRVALADACLEGLGELGDAFDGANQLITEIESGLENDIVSVDDLESDDACTLLLKYLSDPPVLVDEDGDGQAEAGEVRTLLRDALADALDGVSLLDVLLGGSVSEGVATAADATGTSDATGVDIALPSLNLLGNLVDVLTEIVDGFITEVKNDLSTVADVNFDEIEGIPAPEDLVDTLLAAVPQELQDVLADDDPLLEITGGKSVATVVYDRATGEVTSNGQVTPLVIDLADSLATLLGVSDQDPFTVPEGDSVTIAPDTPLESTAKLATCTAEEATQDGLDGERISCAGLELVLLKGLVGDDPETEGEFDGGISVAGAQAQAATFGAPAPEDPETSPPPMPTTGGGAALIGLIAVGAALALRRN